MASFEEFLRAAVQRHLACNLNDNARFLAEQLAASVPSEVRDEKRKRCRLSPPPTLEKTRSRPHDPPKKTPQTN